MGVMDEVLVVISCVLCGVPLVLGCLLAETLARKRALHWQAFAESRGWVYLAKDDGSAQAQLDRFRLGIAGKASVPPAAIANVLKGEHGGYAIICFEYTYRAFAVIGDRPGYSTRFNSVLLLSGPDWKLPDFVLKRRGVRDGTAEFGMGQRVPLGNAAFNDRFVLQGSDGRRISEVFTRDVMNRLLTLGKCHVEGAGDTLLFSYTHNWFSSQDRLRTGDEVESFLEKGCGLAKLLEEAAGEPKTESRQDTQEARDARPPSESGATPADTPLQFTCPHCGLQMSLGRQHAGKRGWCAGCGGAITVPMASRAASVSLAETKAGPVTAPHAAALPESKVSRWPLVVGCAGFGLLVIAALVLVVPGLWPHGGKPQAENAGQRRESAPQFPEGLRPPAFPEMPEMPRPGRSLLDREWPEMPRPPEFPQMPEMPRPGRSLLDREWPEVPRPGRSLLDREWPEVPRPPEFPVPRGPRFGPMVPPFGPIEGGGGAEPKPESPEQKPAPVPPNPLVPAKPAAAEGETAKPSAPDSTAAASPAPAGQAAKPEAATLPGGSGTLLQRAQRLAEQVNALPSDQMQKQSRLMGGFLGELNRIWPAEADRPFAMGVRTGRKPTTGPDSVDWFGFGGAGYWRVFDVSPGKPVLLSARGDGQAIDTIRFTISEKANGDWAAKQKVNGPTRFSGYRWYIYTPQTSRIRVDTQDMLSMFYLRVYQL